MAIIRYGLVCFARCMVTSLLIWCSVTAFAEQDGAAIAILDFHLRDVTLLPGTEAEQARTASVTPLFKAAMTTPAQVRLVSVPVAEQQAADQGVGYLYEHTDVAGALGATHQADWVIVGRVYKPSFLFAYLQAKLISVHSPQRVYDFEVEIKGQQDLVTEKGVTALSQRVLDVLATLPQESSL